MYLVSGWCFSNFEVSLEALKPDMTHITSCINVISMEYTRGRNAVAFWLVLPFEERKNFIRFS